MTIRRLLPLAAMAAAFTGAGAQSEPVAVRPIYRPAMDSLARDTTTRATPDSVRDSTVARPAPQGPGCWRAQSRPRCLGFLVTDFSFEFPVYSTRHKVPLDFTNENRDFEPRVAFRVGFMRNFGNAAMGPVYSFTSERALSGLPWQLEWRYRNWLSASQAIDVGLGYKTNSVLHEDVGEVRGRGATAMVAWTPNRWIGVSGRFDLLGARGRTHRGVMLGVESTRASEFIVRGLVVAAWCALVERIGAECDTGEESSP